MCACVCRVRGGACAFSQCISCLEMADSGRLPRGLQVAEMATLSAVAGSLPCKAALHTSCGGAKGASLGDWCAVPHNFSHLFGTQ